MSIGIVRTKYGLVQGVEAAKAGYEGITCFKGIPYAAPPVRELRWKAPAEPASWNGVRLCDTYAPRAMQAFPKIDDSLLHQEPYASDFYYGEIPDCSEDCLYLNVTTGAESPDEKRPVYMWFHGGGLGSGYSYEVEFDPDELARKGIVVVSVGHRLGAFGYLSLPQLSEEQGGCSGNYGLLDEIKALDWVWENIEAFGGDPENITIGGQSSGTGKSAALASSPLQRGRIRRVIHESTLTWPEAMMMRYPSTEEAEQTGRAFLVQGGIDPDLSPEELRKLPAECFLGNRMEFAIGAMVCDGVCVPYPELWRAIGEYAADCDFLAGLNVGEFSMRTGMFAGNDPVSADEYYSLARERLGDLYDKYGFEENFPCTDETADKLSRRLAAMGLTDFGGEIYCRYFGKYRKERGEKGKTYSYLFSHVLPCTEEERGTDRDQDRLLSWHSSELWYTFASLRKSSGDEANVPPARPWTDTDVRLADQISSYWANFMKCGDPNGTDSEGNILPVWPKSDENMGWMELGDEPQGHSGCDSVLDQMLLEYMLLRKRIPEDDQSV